MSASLKLLTAFGLFACLQFALMETASATSVFQPPPEGVSFRKWVTAAHEIVLARVVAVRRSPDSSHASALDEFPKYEFVFETIERIKGNSPATFSLKSHATWGWVREESVPLSHRSLGAFWLAFSGSDGHEGFTIDRTYLLFRTANGELASMSGREAQRIASTADEWLLAVKRLSSESGREFGRVGSVLELLTSSRAVVLVGTTRCVEFGRGDSRPSEFAIKEQLWGLPISGAELRRYDPFGLETCKQHPLRLLIVPEGSDYDALIRLSVTTENQLVDFAGIVDGSWGGQIEVIGNTILLSQVRIDGSLKWTLADLRIALRSAAAGGGASPTEK